MRKFYFIPLVSLSFFLLFLSAMLSISQPVWSIDAKVKQQIQKEKASIVDLLNQGKISKLEAKIKIAAMKQKIYERSLKENRKEFSGGFKEPVKKVESDLIDAVKAGKISKEEAREKFSAIQSEMRLNKARTEMEERVKAGKLSKEDAHAQLSAMKTEMHLQQVRAQMQERVKAGKLTQEEAEMKMAAIKKEVLEKGFVHEKNKQAEMESHLKNVASDLKKAVEAGKLSAEEAEMKMASIKKEIAEKLEMQEKIKMQEKSKPAEREAQLQKIGSELKKAVDEGKLTKEEAREKFNAIKKDINKNKIF